MWNKLTVEQVQRIDMVRRKAKDTDTLADIECEILAIIRSVPLSVIDSMAWLEFIEARKSLSFLEDQPNSQPIDFIRIGKKRYRFIYDIRQMPFARYIEGKTFAQDFSQSMHKLAATMIMPQKRGFWGWKDDKYDASKHERYANDMLKAPYDAVYASAVFFCNLFKNWIMASRDYMINQEVSKGMTQAEAERVVNDLCKYLDGIIPANR